MNTSGDPTSAEPLLIADGRPRLVVDLSNVCRERALGGSEPAAWHRFVRVMHAWTAQMGGVAHGLAIADASLRPLLRASDRDALKAAERAGIVRSQPGSADPLILELAERYGASVLSDDRFRGHRQRHPWIQGCEDRFFVWNVRKNGEIAIVALDMGRSTPSSLSRHAELDDLRGRGLDARNAPDRELLDRVYRCTNQACLTARLYPDRIQVPPELRGGRPCCPDCGAPLTDLGSRPATVKVVAEDRQGTRLLERVLEDEQELELGRPDLHAGDRRLARVSRRHVHLRLRDGRLWARDLGSRNGTKLIRWDERQRQPRPAIALGEEPQVLGRRDQLVLADALRIRRSGERFAIAPPQPPGVEQPAGGPELTEKLTESR